MSSLPRFFVILASFFAVTGFHNIQADAKASQSERAIEAVKALKKSGAIPEGTQLKIMAKVGYINNLLGPDHELKNRWEKETGVPLVFDTYPNKPIFETLQVKPDIDLILARPREYPDLIHKRLINDLTRFFKKYKMDFKNSKDSGFLFWKAQTLFNGKFVAMPGDGDHTIMFIRKDKLEDPKNKKAFKKKYGLELRAPQTWEEYDKQIEFFHDPEKKFYGTVEQRDPHTGWMFWVSRYASMGAPVRHFFDDNMKPLINSPEGIKATRSYVHALKFSGPKQLKEGNHYSYSLPLFTRGKAYVYVLTPVAAKILKKTGRIDGEWQVIPMPGWVVRGKLISRPAIIYGNNFVVPKTSKVPELAFLYTMYFTDPTNSAKGVSVVSGHADPFHMSHFENPLIREIYTTSFIDTYKKWLPTVVPQGTGLPGDSKYIDALNKSLYQAASGKITPEEAMAKTESAWNKITEEYGPIGQKKFLKRFKKLYPND